MKFRWAIGKKTYFTLTIAWAIFAVINFIRGEFLVGGLEILIALYNLDDARKGKEVELFKFSAEKVGE